MEGSVANMMKAINSRQLRDIHLQKLNDQRKFLVCNMVAQKNVRLFAICSNKQNMQGYRNFKAEAIPSLLLAYKSDSRALDRQCSGCINQALR